MVMGTIGILARTPIEDASPRAQRLAAATLQMVEAQLHESENKNGPSKVYERLVHMLIPVVSRLTDDEAKDVSCAIIGG